MRTASGPESIREANKVLLVYRIQHGDSRSLDDLVFEGGDRERPLSSVRLRYVVSSRRHRPILSPMKPRMQVLKVAPEVCLVFIPCHSIDTRCSICINFIERRLEQFDIDMVEERGEPFLPPFPCCLPYTIQRLCPTYRLLPP